MASATHPIGRAGPAWVLLWFGFLVDVAIGITLATVLTGAVNFGPGLPVGHPGDATQQIIIPAEFAIPWLAFFWFLTTCFVSKHRPTYSGPDEGLSDVEKKKRSGGRWAAAVDAVGVIFIIAVLALAILGTFFLPWVRPVLGVFGLPGTIAFNLSAIVTLLFFLPLALWHLIFDQIIRGTRGWEGRYGNKHQLAQQLDEAFEAETTVVAEPLLRVEPRFRVVSPVTGASWTFPRSDRLLHAFVQAAQSGAIYRGTAPVIEHDAGGGDAGQGSVGTGG